MTTEQTMRDLLVAARDELMAMVRDRFYPADLVERINAELAAPAPDTTERDDLLLTLEAWGNEAIAKPGLELVGGLLLRARAALAENRVAAPPSSRSGAAPAAERTPQDYAIEHAEYMAVDAERLIDAINALAMAEQVREEFDTQETEDEVQAMQDGVAEATRAMRSGIYEFRKRRDRAAPAAVPQPAEPRKPDGFHGDNANLCRSIDALLALDEAGALAPSAGLGGHARTLLAAAASRLYAAPAATVQPALTDEQIDAIAADEGMLSQSYENYPQEYCREFARALLAAARAQE